MRVCGAFTRLAHTLVPTPCPIASPSKRLTTLVNTYCGPVARLETLTSLPSGDLGRNLLVSVGQRPAHVASICLGHSARVAGADLSEPLRVKLLAHVPPPSQSQSRSETHQAPPSPDQPSPAEGARTPSTAARGWSPSSPRSRSGEARGDRPRLDGVPHRVRAAVLEAGRLERRASRVEPASGAGRSTCPASS